MLSDNIRNYRKKNYLSQDELAGKVGVSRQSVSFWETGQTQPTIDNIIALAKIFNISSDALLGSSDNISDNINVAEEKVSVDKKTGMIFLIVGIGIAIAVIIGAVIWAVASKNADSANKNENNSVAQSKILSENSLANKENPKNPSEADKAHSEDNISSASKKGEFDLFSCCKDFAIKSGTLNGDYCMYQQPATKYGGYDNEYFSISYWSDSDMVELCLHCPLDETLSHNFYLRMRGGYNGKYEYASSKYYRNNGESLRFANGYIDPSVFSDSYPISCDMYEGSTDGQNEFMEESRVGICDLIRCLKGFTKAENLGCDFSAFGFVNF